MLAADVKLDQLDARLEIPWEEGRTYVQCPSQGVGEMEGRRYAREIVEEKVWSEKLISSQSLADDTAARSPGGVVGYVEAFAVLGTVIRKLGKGLEDVELSNESLVGMLH